ncbi:MAG: 3-dehydroquinate synthase [Thiotrichales bacterium]|nr:3-dehydroquinate synthase [Thiotrichales bacterium]
MSRTIEIDLGEERRYPIHVGAGVIGERGLFAPHVDGRHAFVVTNETVAPLYLDRLRPALADAVEVSTHVIADGERHKTLDTFAAIQDALVAHRVARDGVVIALGGGVVGDLAGFAAACYQRGVDFVQVPTTLLAQVDSSVGGKTGVNLPGGKNLVGAFHQPRCVVSDTATLVTLDPREVRAGFAEIVKYGLIDDPDFFDWLEANATALLELDDDALATAVVKACERKAALVVADERESGVRALLNLGHTFAHAIETGTGYGAWLHGEAVAAGIVLAARMSHRMGWLAGQDCGRIERLFSRAGLRVRAPAVLSPERMLELMSVDKKVRRGRLRLILLRRIGEAVLTSEFDPQVLRETLETGREAA